MCSVPDAKVPALEEVIALAANAPRPSLLMVELKTDTSPDSADPAALAAAVYKLCAGLGDQVIFVGFDWRALLPLAALGVSCWFTTDRLEGDVRPVINAIAEAGGQGWFPNFLDATPDSIAYARAKGLKVGAWTVNEPADMTRLKGLDALCTDRPDLLAGLA
jgi:glycerophosphoryl diester phosphodiesterase